MTSSKAEKKIKFLFLQMGDYHKICSFRYRVRTESD